MNIHSPNRRARAKIFMHGRSQAVRLPKEFRFQGKEVCVKKVGNGVLLEPIAEQEETVAEWMAKLQALSDGEFKTYEHELLPLRDPPSLDDD